MSTTTTTKKGIQPIKEIGEEISATLGKELIINYQKNNQNNINFYTIGKDILLKILNQPDCQGIKIYKAINETGENTLVFAGVDENGHILKNKSIVTHTGNLQTAKTIIGDRVRPGNTNIEIGDEDSFWEFV